MKFLFLKNREEKNVVTVSCKCNSTEVTFPYSKIRVVPVGYKGDLGFMVDCPNCNQSIPVNESLLSKSFVRKAYKNSSC